MSVFATGGGIVPKAINFVEYLQSSGTQCINTDFRPNQNTRIDMVAELTAKPSGNGMLFGTRSNVSTEFFMYYYGPGSTYYGRYGAGQTAAVTKELSKVSISFNKNVCTVDGNVVNLNYAAFQCTTNAMLFAWNDSGNTQDFVSMKLYSCQIYDDGVLVRDYWPCYGPDGVACLYDKVNEEYVYNAGTGEFVAGGAAA